MPWKAIAKGAVIALKIGIVLLPLIEKAVEQIPKKLPG